MTRLYVDGVPADNYLREIIAKGREGAVNRDDLFWSSQPLLVSAGGDLRGEAESQARDIFQVEFSGLRPVNHIDMKIARFPHLARAEYWHPTRNEWVPLREQIGAIQDLDPAYDVSEQREKWEGPPVSYRVSDSSPVQISSVPKASNIITATHPQHFGSNHWVRVKWNVVPVQTKAIRISLVRTMQGFHPVNPQGRRTAYPLGVKDFSAGFRVYAREDVPPSGRITLDDFATSTNMAGHRISYRLRESKPRNVLDSVVGQHWRCEPQPVNYSVVNFYADVRGDQGQSQIIDRFFVDPLTVGPTMNLYYTDEDPDDDFAADDTPLLYPLAEPKGSALERERDPLDNSVMAIGFSDEAPAFVDVSNAYLQWDPSRPWWLGMDVELGTTEGMHPWASFSGNTLRQNERTVEFITSTGEAIVVPFRPEFGTGMRISVLVLYTPPGNHDGTYYPSTVTVFLGRKGLPSSHNSVQVRWDALGTRPDVFSVGRYSTEGTPGIPAFSLRSMVLKVDELPEPGFIEGFLSAPETFVLKPEYETAPDLTTNALLRAHPLYSTQDNPSGMVGGTGNRYEDAVWTPVSRDYVLRQGFLRFPPTRAKHFKFEFTNLVHEPYDALVAIRREVKLFPTEVVANYNRGMKNIPQPNVYWPDDDISRPRESNFDYSGSPGVRTMMELTDLGKYESAVARLQDVARFRRQGRESATEAYVADDPAAQETLRDLGWIWSYTPWHIASSAPKWTLKQRHTYERVTVEHRTRSAFFVGLRRLEAYRVNYATDDDTDIYLEPFLDDSNIESMEGVIVDPDGGIRSFGGYAKIESKTFPSTRMVRGLQYATVQSELLATLPDDGFINDDLSAHWDVYGDASLERRAGEGVVVSRGWFRRTHGDLEVFTYGDLEDNFTYGGLEGSSGSGSGGGGIESEKVTPTTSGRIHAAARVTALTKMAGPVRLEIVSVDTGAVLALEERNVAQGQEVVLSCGYSVGSALERSTYGDIEDALLTHGDLEDNYTYGDLETAPIEGDVYVRLYQANPSKDRFLVERLSLFDSPVVWSFSVDGGLTWRDPADIRNDPHKVLTFPEVGNALKWKVEVFHPDAEVSALSLRPWYGGLLGSLTRSATDFVGPNRSVLDDYPDIEEDPMWQSGRSVIPSWWFQRDVASQFGKAPLQPAVVGSGSTISPLTPTEPID